nr:threonine synthase [Bacilli bacterium]
MIPYSFLTHLECSKCGKRYEADVIQQTCHHCHTPLLARYDLEAMKGVITKEEWEKRPQNFWRYHELLPLRDPSFKVSMNEPMSPIVTLPRTAETIGMKQLLAKDEGVLPSGSFKARGASIGISRAKELGVTKLGIPTNGNAGAAWALYSARAGIEATVIMPKDAPLAPQKECVVAGANVYLIDGTIGDAGNIIHQKAREEGLYDVSTLLEPYRLEGKKTMGFEIAEQFGWSVPDVIVYPTGGGAGVIGIYKALTELQALGFIGPKLPRIAIVQAVGCAPLVKAFEEGKEDSIAWENPQTVAFGMRVPKALGDYMILDVIRKTGGTAITVTDEEIKAQRMAVVEQDGFHVCPEGAAGIAGVKKLVASGWIQQDETVLAMNTGSGLKYIDQIVGVPAFMPIPTFS